MQSKKLVTMYRMLGWVGTEHVAMLSTKGCIWFSWVYFSISVHCAIIFDPAYTVSIWLMETSLYKIKPYFLMLGHMGSRRGRLRMGSRRDRLNVFMIKEMRKKRVHYVLIFNYNFWYACQRRLQWPDLYPEFTVDARIVLGENCMF